MESLPLPTTQRGPKLSGLRMAHLNICSLANKTDQLMDIIAKDKCDVVAITETHLSHEIGDSLVEIEGFTMFRKDRNRKGGGVVIYCRFELNTKLADYSKDNIGTFEFLSIELKFTNAKPIVFYCDI